MRAGPLEISVNAWEPTDEDDDRWVDHTVPADEVAVPDEVVASLMRQGKVSTNEGSAMTLQDLFDLVME